MAKGFVSAYIDSLRTVRGGDVLLAVVVGAISGLMLLFLFPGAALSTLMHEVLKLPGPGAGIGFVVGPYMVLWALIVWIHRRKAGLAFYVCAVSGMVQAYAGDAAGASSVLGPTVAPQMMLAGFVLGISVDLLAFATRDMADWKATKLTAVISDIIFLCVYWVAVFPTVKGWVQPVPAVIMIVLSLIGAVLFGAVIAQVYGLVTGRARKDAPRRAAPDMFGEEE